MENVKVAGTHKGGWEYPKLPGGQEQSPELWQGGLTVGVSKPFTKS